MNGVFYIGATGLRSQEAALDILANNIANLNTAGYKRSAVRFSEMMSPRDDLAALQPGDGAGFSGVKIDPSTKVFAQGELKPTGNPLDLAIKGEGFVELLGPAGQTMLWRGGTLKVNADGFLAAANGMALKAMISAPTDAASLAIEADGHVRAIGADGKSTDIGRIELAMPKDMTALAAVDDGLYTAPAETLTSAAPGEEGAGLLTQGSIETSNVQLSDEMVMLLMMQRAYGANAQVVQAGDQLMAMANGLKR